MFYTNETTLFPTVAAALENLTVDNLKQLLNLLPISERATRKSALVERIRI